jgi:leucyl aminopeptidase (aminopeptidase T)
LPGRVDLAEGARNAVESCLGVGPADRFLLVGDEATAEIDDALEVAALATGAACLRLELERYGERPIPSLPDSIVSELRAFDPNVSAIAIRVVAGELPFTRALRLLLVDDFRCRHAQMAGISRQMMEEGMAADYVEVAKLAARLHEIVRPASEISVTGDMGTDLVARFTSAHRWIGGNAIYREPGQWGNLPAGEVATSPLTVDGVIATKVIGEQFGRYGMLDEPARFTISDGQVVGVDAPSPAGLEDELLAYLDGSPCSRRVGEFAIGCNTALEHLIGELLQDEKFPGVHIAFGDPYPRETGADWSCPTHVDVVASGCTITVDGACIMDDGVFLV